MSYRKMVIDKKEIAPGIIIYKNVINNYDSLIDQIETSVSLNEISWSTAAVKNNNKYGSNKSQRDTEIIEIPYFNNNSDAESLKNSFQIKMNLIMFNSFTPIEQDYMKFYNIGYITWHERYSILKYSLGQKFVNHIDDHSHFHRRISYVYYLNDNYLGGEIVFPRFNISYKPKANEMLIFPSTYVYNHSVLPVTEGTRYSIVSWLR